MTDNEDMSDKEGNGKGGGSNKEDRTDEGNGSNDGGEPEAGNNK